MASEHKHFRKECKPVFMEYRFSFRWFGFWFFLNKNPLPYKNEIYYLYGVGRTNYIIGTNSNNWKKVSFWFSQHNNMGNIIFQVSVTLLNKVERFVEFFQIELSPNANCV